MPTLGFVRATWTKNGFTDTTKFIVLDMKNDAILGQDFWIKYQVVPDYVSLGIRVHAGATGYHLHGMDIRPHLRILENLPGPAELVNHNAFKRLLRKGAEPFLYVIRHGAAELEPIEQTTKDPELDRALGPLLDVFMSELPDKPPPERAQDHRIETGDAHPINKSPYSLSKEQLDEQARQIKYLMDRDLVRPSTSPWGAPVLFAKKKDGTWRMCIDYRGLNAVTVRNGYPLPKIQDCLDMIGTATYFSKIDLTSGYWQINVAEKDRPKTAFNTRTGKYEFCVMPFGLTNAPATFQAIMNDMLRPYLDDFAVVYLDDILIYSKTREEHIEHVRKVMQCLHDHNLYAKPSKCAFLQQTIEFCGHVVGQGKVRMDLAKVKVILDWPPLQTVHDVRSFLGLCAYYRRFILDFAQLAGPLYELIKGSEGRRYKTVHLNHGAQLAFDRLKETMASHTVLTQPDVSKPFIIETDASDFGWGAVLLQVGEDGFEHPITFESKQFTPAERNYATHERELLAIKEALRKWRCYIENGTVTTVRTDHAGLQYLKTTVKPSGRLARWLMEFGSFNLNIIYKPGTEMIIADTLSRRRGYHLRTMEFDDALRAYARDGKFSGDEDVDRELRKYGGQLMLDDDDTIYHRDSADDTWAPYTEHWARSDLLNQIHNQYGHVAHETMFDIIRVRQWWPGMRQDIRHFVQHCSACQLAAKPREVYRDEMHPSHTWKDRSQPFERWGLDLIGVLPTTENGNRWIVTAIDYATRWPVAESLKDATAETLADFVVRRIYRDYGTPKEIITDRGANLWAPAMGLVFKRLGTKHRGTTPYHPRTNGAVERYNGVLGQMITKYLIGHPIKDWDKYLEQALFATRIRTHSTTKMSPFYLLYGVNPTLPGDASMPTPDRYDERIDPAPFLSRERAAALQSTMTKALENKKKWDSQVNDKDKFQVGDWVLIRTKKPKKFEVHWYGPYQIVRKEILNTYLLKAPGGAAHKYLISGDRIKKARVEGRVTRGWRMPKGPGKPKKVTDDMPYDARASDHAVAVRPLEDFDPLPEEEEHATGDQIV